MPLTCYCEWEPEPGNWCWYGPDDYSTFEASRRKRCSSCHNLIDHASIVAKFERRRIPATDVEVAIFGEEGEIPLPPSISAKSAPIFGSRFTISASSASAPRRTCAIS